MKEIPLHGKYGNGLYALVSDKDFNRVIVHKWRLHYSKGMAFISARINGKNIYISRFITDAPEGMVVDHENADRFDNTRENLRVCTQRQNLASKRVFKTKAIYRGVYLDVDRERRGHRNFWQSRIKYFDQTIHLGRYSTAEEAAYVFDQASIQLNGEFARLNVLSLSGTA